MAKILKFPDLLRLIDERAVAFRDVVAAAPGLDVPVPTCPGWTLRDLVLHLGQGQRRWAAVVAAGPSDGPPEQDAPAVPRGHGALLTWWAESTEHHLAVLREHGPDRGCWTWWDLSESPQTSGAVARHRLQEIAVHTHDAQVTLGAPEPLPVDVALDGVDEFLTTCCATTIAWPHKPGVVDFHTVEGRSWRLALDADGARTTAADGTGADAAAHGTAGDLVLVLYDRVPLDTLRIDGDRRLFEQLRAWDPEE